VNAEHAFPVLLSLQVATAALLVTLPFALPLARLQARSRYRGRSLVDAAVLLPLVLPPSVVGYLLVLVFGRGGPLGGLLDAAGLRIIFTPAAAIIASAVVAFPILTRSAQAAIAAVPRDIEEAAASLGLAPAFVFARVTVPAAWRGLAAAAVLAFARAMGEFGATLMFAGNMPGSTNTMPLEIFSAYESGDDGRALVYVALLTAVSLAVVLAASQLETRSAERDR